MKLIIYGAIILVCGPALAIKSGDLKSQCDVDNGVMIYKQIIKSYNASVMWRPDDISLDAINIKIDDQWYGAIADDRTNGNVAKGMSSFAQAAYLISLPVNVCVKEGYLRGVEGAG
ncbi:putative lipoprotein [Yersinia enterocolitica]|uniref:putative AB5 enterotoxin binding subunit YtxB n=1 Tax=Yersinia enterocolitica TaxID=630 RepID=UPI00028194AB|nr:putative AB5 enterotoxin binding subunit YtxB [Yersinia enterocolitica]AJI81987.1 putative ytxB [Yersinia enterocolitica]EKA27812.1 transaldolase [Yersinia enterocolitica subsp. enterocolitica WA-314]ELI8282752.1 putative AB5 enterotoxin binding subunit YtxB [Yersinia enterocolitica]KGA71248.1 putative ytxB [Yersinia enterocolitica]KGA77922.1 putative ytxB [Yersinia enterocolitica]